MTLPAIRIPLCRHTNLHPKEGFRPARLALGDFTQCAEDVASEYLSRQHGMPIHAVLVDSCTGGMQVVLRALQWDQFHCPSFTWRATAAAIYNATSTRPTLMDCNLDTFTATGGRADDYQVRVNVFGQPPDEPSECLGWIVDAAHGLGGTEPSYKKPPSAWVYSLSPTKVFTGDGKGGIIATPDGALAEECRQLRYYGSDSLEGFNAYPSERTALHTVEGFKHIDRLVERRREIASVYGQLPVQRQIQPLSSGAFKDFAILIDDPDDLQRHLREQGIESRRYFTPLHHWAPYRERSRAERYALTELVYSQVLCLPIWGEMDPKAAQVVADSVRIWLNQRSRYRAANAT